MTRGHHDSNTPEENRDLWRTPPAIFNAMDREFDFTTDVAADYTNALCASYLTPVQDALDPETEWGARNFCNPPYSDIMPWVQRADVERQKGNTTVMLIPAGTSEKWFKRAWETAHECRLITGRLAFISSATGKPVSGNNKGSAIFIWRGNAPIGTLHATLISRTWLLTNGHKP